MIALGKTQDSEEEQIIMKYSQKSKIVQKIDKRENNIIEIIRELM